MRTIRVDTLGEIIGRNGTFEITAVEIAQPGPNWVYIDGIGKRDRPINGGLRVCSPKAMDAIARKWLESRDYRVTGKPVEPEWNRGER